MKPSGIIKKIDEMGRIVIPKEIRTTMGVDTGDRLQFFIDGDSVVMKKLSVSCIFCGSENDLTELNEKHICAECISKLK